MARPDHRLLEISHQLERLAGQLSTLTVERGARTPTLTPTLVRSVLAVRLIAPDHLDRDLGEPARNMLLSLYAARLEGRDLPPTRLAESAAVPLATGLHWIARMRLNDPPPIPPMTVDQAIQLLSLHRNTVRLSWDEPHRRRRRGESPETYTARLIAMTAAAKGREADVTALRRLTRYEATGDWHLPGEKPPELPPLALVTGWSKANPDRAKATYNPNLALFGGWRLKDWEKRRRRG